MLEQPFMSSFCIIEFLLGITTGLTIFYGLLFASLPLGRSKQTPVTSSDCSGERNEMELLNPASTIKCAGCDVNPNGYNKSRPPS